MAVYRKLENKNFQPLSIFLTVSIFRQTE